MRLVNEATSPLNNFLKGIGEYIWGEQSIIRIPIVLNDTQTDTSSRIIKQIKKGPSQISEADINRAVAVGVEAIVLVINIALTAMEITAVILRVILGTLVK